MLTIISLTALISLAAAASTPSYDCNQSSSSVEEYICQSPELAALDRRLADTYTEAMQHMPVAEQAPLRAEQRGWIKGRNDCWKADNIEQCITSSYQVRIVQLQIAAGLLEAPTAISLRCQPQQPPVFIAFYPQTEPPAAVLTIGNDQVYLFRQSSASGSKYSAAGVVFWEHQGEATIDWYDTKLSCQRI